MSFAKFKEHFLDIEKNAFGAVFFNTKARKNFCLTGNKFGEKLEKEIPGNTTTYITKAVFEEGKFRKEFGSETILTDAQIEEILGI